jgi:hypothetical protein
MKKGQIQRIITFFTCLALLSGCDAQVNTTAEVPYQKMRPESFNGYWYSGKAELNRYELTQSRYGEMRQGEVVMVFVTEDFLNEKQVKKEFGNDASKPVLKLNIVKKFITGIYDYSIMTSIFTPIEYFKFPMTEKVTLTSQDWCGQSFSQMNLDGKEMHFQLRSYFQAEADKDTTLASTYIEDDIWNRMRLEPQSLPLGNIRMVPSQEFLRLNHERIGAYEAKATLVLQVNDNKTNKEFYVYTIQYPGLNRTLKVHCESKFPFQITYWEETTNASQPERKQVTKATLTQSLWNAYWELNGNTNESLRDSLGIKYHFAD